jgi:hypothetical protein
MQYVRISTQSLANKHGYIVIICGNSPVFLQEEKNLKKVLAYVCVLCQCILRIVK